MSGQFWQNPYFQMGVGLLSGNQGVTGDQAFRNALSGGMSGVLRGQTIVSDIQQREQQRKLAEIQQQWAAMQLKQQQALSTAAPQYVSALLSGDPAQQKEATVGILTTNPELLPALLTEQMKRGMLGLSGGQALSRQEFLKEYDASKYTPESFKAGLATGDPSVLQPAAPRHGFSEETTLRKEAGQRIEPIRTAVQQGKQLDRLLDRKGPFSDVASVYSLIRFLDPGSVVREGEIGIVSAAQGLWNQIQGMLQQAQGQGFLTDAMRQDMRGMIGELMNLYELQYNNFKGYYEGVAGQLTGISPRRVVGAPMTFPTMTRPNPVGTTQVPSTPELNDVLRRNR